MINWEKSQIKAEKHAGKSLFLFFRSESINLLTLLQVPLVALKIAWGVSLWSCVMVPILTVCILRTNEILHNLRSHRGNLALLSTGLLFLRNKKHFFVRYNFFTSLHYPNDPVLLLEEREKFWGFQFSQKNYCRSGLLIKCEKLDLVSVFFLDHYYEVLTIDILKSEIPLLAPLYPL